MSAPAGWYDDPEMVNTRRYWDGGQWTDHRQEKAASQASPAPQDASQWEIWAMVAAVFVAPLGLVMGLVLWARGFRGGRTVVVTALIVMVVSYLAVQLLT